MSSNALTHPRCARRARERPPPPFASPCRRAPPTFPPLASASSCNQLGALGTHPAQTSRSDMAGPGGLPLGWDSTEPELRELVRELR